ncbi:MAG: hypothetical protein QGI78_00730, partial [Phycisphaerales bacterium]|nr:hypothetical protein [Phycisphaerales bacterium]
VSPNTSPSEAPAQEDESHTYENEDIDWQGQAPKLFDAIYYDHLARSPQRQAMAEELNEGEHTKTWCEENNVAVQSMIYNGAVDWYEDGAYDDVDRAKFTEWLDANVPLDYDGPLCLDMEGEWWNMWHTESQVVMDIVIDFYLEGLEFAKSKRPNAKIGYWGLPRRRHTSPNYTTASVDRLLKACTGLFPDVYEWNPGQDDSAWIKRHVTNTMALVEGQVPVFVQTCPRFKETGRGMKLHAVEEFIHDQVQASLAAVWTDEEGNEHRIAGISMWDAYLYCWQGTYNWSSLGDEDRKALFNELDEYHKNALACMKSCIDALTNASQQEAASSAEAIAQAAEEEAARVAAARAEASRLRAERKRQRSRLVRRLNSERTKIRRATAKWRTTARGFRSARSSYKNKRRSYINSRTTYRTALKAWRTKGRKQARGSKARSTAWRTFAKARKQFVKSQRSWRSNVRTWRASVKNFRSQRNSYRASRTKWRSTVKTWRTANARWRQMARTASTLAAVGK